MTPIPLGVEVESATVTVWVPNADSAKLDGVIVTPLNVLKCCPLTVSEKTWLPASLMVGIAAQTPMAGLLTVIDPPFVLIVPALWPKGSQSIRLNE